MTQVKRGRPATFDFNNKKEIVHVLKQISEGAAEISRFIMNQFVEHGYVTLGEPIKTGQKGRPKTPFILSKKGKNLLNLSKNWKLQEE